MKPYIILFFINILVVQVSMGGDMSALHYNLVSLQESVEVEVENDVMHARVSVRHDGLNAKDVAKAINTDMQWALKQVRKHKTVKAQTLNYSTYPQYKDRRIKSWSGSQEMSLESADFDVLTKLIADLQTRLQVKNIRFAVSPAKYKQTEDSLLAAAVKAFHKKAELIAKAMGKKSFTVVNMDVNTNRYYAQQVRQESRSLKMMSADMAIAEPGVVAGTNQVRVNVSGQIQSK